MKVWAKRGSFCDPEAEKNWGWIKKEEDAKEEEGKVGDKVETCFWRMQSKWIFFGWNYWDFFRNILTSEKAQNSLYNIFSIYGETFVIKKNIPIICIYWQYGLKSNKDDHQYQTRSLSSSVIYLYLCHLAVYLWSETYGKHSKLIFSYFNNLHIFRHILDWPFEPLAWGVTCRSQLPGWLDTSLLALLPRRF